MVYSYGNGKRHLYVQGSNNFQFTPCILPEDDFFCGIRFRKDRLIRGSYATCDAPLGQIQRPTTAFSYDAIIRPTSSPSSAIPGKNINRQIQYVTGVMELTLSESEELIPEIPVISHEIGQYETFPDFSEIDKYNGVLKSENLCIFRQRPVDARLSTFGRNHRLSLIYEVYCNNCHILICTADLTSLTDSLPGKWLLESLCAHLGKNKEQTADRTDILRSEILTIPKETLLFLFME